MAPRAGHRKINILAALACLVYCSCGHLVLLADAASVHAASPTSRTPQRLPAHDPRGHLHTEFEFEGHLDTMRLPLHAEYAQARGGPQQQRRPSHALSTTAAEDASSGLRHRKFPQHRYRPRVRTADSSTHTRARSAGQRQQKIRDLYKSGGAGTVADDAVVTGPASAELQSVFEAEYDLFAYDDSDGPTGTAGGSGPSRRLLQSRRRRRPFKYARCPQCKLRRCDSVKCTGLCRRNRRLFECRTAPLGMSVTLSKGEPDGVVAPIPISSLDSPLSLAVSAPSPYIGCALIANSSTPHSGCPASGTRGRTNLQGRSTPVEFEVGTSTCAFQRYLPRSSLVYPFGICLCSRVAGDGPTLSAGPCDITELDIVDSPPARGERDVFIETRGSVTSTRYSDFPDDLQSRVARFTMLVSEASLTVSIDSMPALFQGGAGVSVLLGGEIELTLEAFSGVLVTADESAVSELPAAEAVAVSGDYYAYDDTDEPATEVGRAVGVRRELVRVPFTGILPTACDPEQNFRRPVPYFYDYDCSNYDYDYEYHEVEYYL